MDATRWILCLTGSLIAGALPTLALAQADGLDAPPIDLGDGTTLSVAAPAAATPDAPDAVTVDSAREMRLAPPEAPPGIAPPTTLAVPSGYTARQATDPEGHSRSRVVPRGVADDMRVPGRPIEVDEDHSRMPRIGMLTLVGGATMVGASFGMFEVGCALGGGRDDFGADGGCYLGGYALGIASALSLTPLSVWLTGKLMDGNGGYGWTLMGTGVGTVAGSLGALAMVASGVSGDENFIPLMIGPALGAILLYELSSDPSREAIVEAERAVTVGASFAPMDGGGLVNVVGTF